MSAEITKDAKHEPVARKSEQHKLLLSAVKAGDIGTVNSLVTSKVDPDAGVKETGETPLLTAARAEHCSMFMLLLEAKADATITYENSNIAYRVAFAPWATAEKRAALSLLKGLGVCLLPIHEAATLGNEAGVIAELKEHRQSKDSQGNTVFHYASQNGQLAVVELLIREGVSLRSVDNNGCMPLHLAAYGGHIEIARKLLEMGAPVRGKDNGGRTALHYAASNGQQAMMEFLIKKGASIEDQDSYEKTALHDAASNGHQAAIELLLKQGASVNAIDYFDMAPLHYAVSAGHHATVKFLLEHRASATQKVCPSDLTPLYFAVKDGHIETVELLLKNGALIEDACTGQGESPLHVAAHYGQLAMMKFLIGKSSALINKEIYGHTPLHAAARHGGLEAVKLLLQNGADINAQDSYGATVLHSAASKSQTAILELLLEHNRGLINVKAKNDRTALHLIVRSNELAAVELLLKNGASINERDQDGYTALELYLRDFGPATPVTADHIPMIRLLIKRGAEVSKAMAERHPIVEQEIARRRGLTLVEAIHPRLNARSFFPKILRHSLWDQQALLRPLGLAGVMSGGNNKPASRPVEPKSPG